MNLKKKYLPIIAGIIAAGATVLFGGANPVAAIACTDSAYSGDASAKLGHIGQPDYSATAALAFDANCKPTLAITPDALTNGAVQVDVSNPDPLATRWSIVKIAADTWTATLRATGAHAQVVVNGVLVNMKANSTVTFKVTGAGSLWFKASGFAFTGQTFESQAKGTGFVPVP